MAELVSHEGGKQHDRSGELSDVDAIRQYGVILDWGTGQLLAKTTEQFRAMLKRRTVPHWRAGLPPGARA